LFSNLNIPASKIQDIFDFGNIQDYRKIMVNINLNDENFYSKKEREQIFTNLGILQEKGIEIVISYNIFEYSYGYDFIFEIAQRYGASHVSLKVTNTCI